MGAKIPVRLKTRRATCRCDLCGSTFQNIQALRTHQAYLHPRTKRMAYKSKIEVIARRKALPLKKSKITSSKASKPAKVVKEVEEKTPEVKDESKEINVRRSGFECPVCSKLFTVYFSAYRHIQNIHCVNDKGEAVSPNSSSLIKPIFVEQCINCSARVDTDHHTCPDFSKLSKENEESKQTCLGCKQEFQSMHLFAKHISKEHSDVENIFFPDISKFMMWKKSMESQTETKYLDMKKKDNMQFFHCNHFTLKDATSMFCPSSITVQVFSKGVLVTYQKEHFGHEAKKYVSSNVNRKYTITSLLKDTEHPTEKRINVFDNDMYLQLRRLMDNIVIGAVKANTTNLKLLLEKALDMATVLNNQNNDEEQENALVSKDVTHEKINKLAPQPQKNKRDINDDNNINVKRVKQDSVAEVEPRVILNTVTTKATVDTKEKETKEPIREPRVTINTRSNQSMKLEEAKKDAAKKDAIKSPTSFSETYQNFIDVNFKSSIETPKPKKKEPLKTKMGQFKPNISPKVKEELPKIQLTKSLPKPDIQYEVLERENDCNIMIIKI